MFDLLNKSGTYDVPDAWVKKTSPDTANIGQIDELSNFRKVYFTILLKLCQYHRTI